MAVSVVAMTMLWTPSVECKEVPSGTQQSPPPYGHLFPPPTSSGGGTPVTPGTGRTKSEADRKGLGKGGSTHSGRSHGSPESPTAHTRPLSWDVGCESLWKITRINAAPLRGFLGGLEASDRVLGSYPHSSPEQPALMQLSIVLFPFHPPSPYII